MSRFYKYGRWWYTKRVEAETARRYNERVYFDDEMKAYYLCRPRPKTIWEEILGW